MHRFPGNKLSSLTTLLPTPLTLFGDWQVALLEISWPAMVRKVTEGNITVSKCQNAEQRQESKKTFKSGFHDDQQHTSESTVVKTSGQWPVDVNAGSHTHNIFVLRFGSE